MVGNWEVRTIELFSGYNVRIYLINKDTVPRLARIKDGFLEMEEIKEGVEMEPTMTLPMDVWEALKATMTTNHEREKSTVESELKATKYHLEDMRTLALPTKLEDK